MMKKVSKILSMVIVVGMIAAIPASTQVVSRSTGEPSDDGNLPMLILVNRLELSEEQMEGLHDILIDLLEEKETGDALRAEFEDVMIRFSGTGEELDELLGTFREDQQAMREALHESIEASLDELRDLLSINQGIVLREALPKLLGIGVSTRTDHGVDGLRNASMSSMMQERLSGATMPEMFAERFGQDIGDDAIGTMREQMHERFEQFGERVPDELREQLAERFGGNLGQMGGQAGNVTLGQRVMGQLGANLHPTQRLQSIRGEHGNPFELLEQVIEVLELKIEAMK